MDYRIFPDLQRIVKIDSNPLVKNVVNNVCSEFKMNVNDLDNHKLRKHSDARAAISYILHERGLKFSEIGDFLGISRASSHHAKNRANNFMYSDGEFRSLIKRVSNET